MEENSLNPKFIGIIVLVAICYCLIYPATVWGAISYPFNYLSQNNDNTAYLIGLANNNSELVQNMKNNPEIMTALITNNTSSLNKYVTVTVTITPTPNGINYFASEYQNGTRLMGHPYSIVRHNNYITGVHAKNESVLKITTNVYDYMVLPYFNWKNEEKTNSPNDIYDIQYPINSNDEFLFVFLYCYSNDISSSVPAIMLPQEINFALQIDDTLYYPQSKYPKQITIKEMENVLNLNKNSFATAYGQYKYYTHEFQIDKDSNDEEYGKFIVQGLAGYKSIQDYTVPIGVSNLEDGYMLFEIPKDTDLRKAHILLNYYAFGNADWILWNENSPDYNITYDV
jgi:hypothetical protein